MKLIIEMKFTDDSRLINKLIAKKLIKGLFSYLSYLHLTFLLFRSLLFKPELFNLII